MPLTVFIILGVIQVCLLTQSRAMLKYAAYRAARAGALHNGCQDKMMEAARTVMIPMMHGTNSLMPAKNLSSYMVSYAEAIPNRTLPDFLLQEIEIRICGPLKDWITTDYTFSPQNEQSEVDFDQLWNTEAITGVGAPADVVESFERTKLKVQVKFYQRLIIPFVDATIYHLWRGETTFMSLMSNGPRADSSRAGMFDNDVGQKAGGTPAAETNFALTAGAWMGHYYLPMYASYAFRMQSNFFPDTTGCELPAQNTCWHYSSDDTGP